MKPIATVLADYLEQQPAPDKAELIERIRKRVHCDDLWKIGTENKQLTLDDEATR